MDLGAAALRKRGGRGWRVEWTGDMAEKGRVVVGSLWGRVFGGRSFQHVKRRIVGVGEMVGTLGCVDT